MSFGDGYIESLLMNVQESKEGSPTQEYSISVDDEKGRAQDIVARQSVDKKTSLSLATSSASHKDTYMPSRWGACFWRTSFPGLVASNLSHQEFHHPRLGRWIHQGHGKIK